MTSPPSEVNSDRSRDLEASLGSADSSQSSSRTKAAGGSGLTDGRGDLSIPPFRDEVAAAAGTSKASGLVDRRGGVLPPNQRLRDASPATGAAGIFLPLARGDGRGAEDSLGTPSMDSMSTSSNGLLLRASGGIPHPWLPLAQAMLQH